MDFELSLNAALGLFHLKYADEQIRRRGWIDAAYRERLERMQDRGGAPSVGPCLDKKPVPFSVRHVFADGGRAGETRRKAVAG
jgi:dTDP-4-amino-4,6-dideoxygalactose transaminase